MGGMNMQNLMNNPEMMQQAMNNPMMQGLLNNPDLLREMMMANPTIRQIAENNPEVGQILSDPEMLRRSMELARNPNLMREMMRNSDRAMSDIENLPGGYDALRRLYNDVQQPLHEAAENMANQANPEPQSNPQNNANQSGPLPNPWDQSQSQQQQPQANAQANPFNMFGGMGANPFGGMDMGMGNQQNFQQMYFLPTLQKIFHYTTHHTCSLLSWLMKVCIATSLLQVLPNGVDREKKLNLGLLFLTRFPLNFGFLLSASEKSTNKYNRIQQ